MIYAVMGCTRSGTSAIAGVMKILGVYMGETEEYNHECVLMRDGSMDDRIEAIKQRQRPWGFKDPGSHGYIDHLLPYGDFRFIVVLRDPEAIMRSKVKRSPADHSSRSKHKMRELYADTHRELMRFYYYEEPVLYVSWEKFDVFELAGFCGVEITSDMRNEIGRFLAGGYASLANPEANG